MLASNDLSQTSVLDSDNIRNNESIDNVDEVNNSASNSDNTIEKISNNVKIPLNEISAGHSTDLNESNNKTEQSNETNEFNVALNGWETPPQVSSFIIINFDFSFISF